MINFIYCNYTPLTKQQVSKAILFENANKNDFKFVFTFDGIDYYKKITK